ncbi:MAG: hypothetical protein ABIF09_03885 [Gemmatimonadota bacterium]
MSKAMRREDFIEAVNRTATEIDVRIRVSAADFFLDLRQREKGQLTETDVDLTVELARRMAVTSSRHGESRTEEVRLRETAYARQNLSTWLEVLAPLFSRQRNEIFGSPSVPFPGRYPDAVNWIEEKFDRLPVFPGEFDEEVLRLKTELNHAALELGKMTGLVIGTYPNRLLLLYWSRDHSRVERREIHNSGKRIIAPSAIARLAHEARALEQLTGIDSADWVGFLMSEAVPPATRALISVKAFRERINKETVVEGSRITVEFLTPDVTWGDLRTLHEQLREFWREEGVGAGKEVKDRTRVTDLDQALLDLVERLGPPPVGAGASEWWNRVAGMWVEEGRPPRPVTTHRRHWRRLREKLPKIGFVPKVKKWE